MPPLASTPVVVLPDPDPGPERERPTLLTIVKRVSLSILIA